MSSKQIYKNANGVNAEVTLVNPDTNFNKRTVELNSIMDKTPTIATLRAKTEIPETIYVTGYHTANDGAFGSHFFRWNSTSTEADNGGTIIKLDGVATGRYELQYDNAVNVKWFGANETRIDNEIPIQKAVDAVGNGGAVYFPAGTYEISGHIEERTNGGRRLLYGESQKNTIIKASSSFNSVARGYMLWFGTQTGHSSYAFRMRDLQLNANNIAEGCLNVNENGQGDIRDCQFANFIGAAYRTSAAVDAKISNCEFYSSNVGSIGIVATVASSNAKQDTSGYSFAYSPGFSGSNEFKIKDCWFSNLSGCVFANGDAVYIEGCTSQSCGQSLTDDLFLITDEAYDSEDWHSNYPVAGATIRRVWSEGGTSRYAIRVKGYVNGLIESCEIIGSSTVENAAREGGILIEAEGYIARNNVFYQFFTATPTEGRLDNASIYVTPAGKSSRLYDNLFVLTQQGNQPYEEGTGYPTASKSGTSEYMGVVGWDSSGTPYLVHSTNNIYNVISIGVGAVQINYKHNTQFSDNPVVVSVGSNGTEERGIITYRNNSNDSIRLYLRKLDNTSFTPTTNTRVTFQVFANSSTSTT